MLSPALYPILYLLVLSLLYNTSARLILCPTLTLSLMAGRSQQNMDKSRTRECLEIMIQTDLEIPSFFKNMLVYTTHYQALKLCTMADLLTLVSLTTCNDQNSADKRRACGRRGDEYHARWSDETDWEYSSGQGQ